MKKLLYIGALSALLLAGCSEDEAKDDTPKVVEEVKAEPEEVSGLSLEKFKTSYIDKLTMAFSPTAPEKISDTRYSIALDSDIFLFLDMDNKIVKEASIAAVTTSFNDKKIKMEIAFEALAKTVDETLNETQIDKLFQDLKITWDLDMLNQTNVESLNDVTYRYKGDNANGSIVLQAISK